MNIRRCKALLSPNLFTSLVVSTGRRGYETSRLSGPVAGFQHAHAVNRLTFVDDEHANLKTATGFLCGFIVVHRQPERMNRGTMPIRIAFDGPTTKQAERS